MIYIQCQLELNFIVCVYDRAYKNHNSKFVKSNKIMIHSTFIMKVREIKVFPISRVFFF